MLSEHCQLWWERCGVAVSISTMSRAIKWMGWTEKKGCWVPASEPEPTREAWREQVAEFDAERLVFVDECGSNVGLTPIYGWAPKGMRVYGTAPKNRGKNTTLIAAMSVEGIGEAMTLEGAADSTVFVAYVERVLAPSLRAGQVVMMDNLGAHKGERVRRLIEARNCKLLFLPSYSPDLSPIEEAFSKLKAYLRQAQARTREELQEAPASALGLITSHDARAYFNHCGYQVKAQSL